jgi:Flp pilus assembly pilin Flp
MRDKVMNRVSILLGHFRSKKGQALVEYALVLSLISVLAISALNTLGIEIRGIYFSIDNSLSTALAGIR